MYPLNGDAKEEFDKGVRIGPLLEREDVQSPAFFHESPIEQRSKHRSEGISVYG
jgi:hypothetical protein